MNQEEFNRMYLGEFKPDPVIEECVAFLRWATPAEVSAYRRDGLFSPSDIRAARRILAEEDGAITPRSRGAAPVERVVIESWGIYETEMEKGT